jgi:nucleotide-binding universal stress UspA family protein
VTKGEHCHGFAGAVLVEAAKGASMLVVGSRGHSGLTDLLIGSVSEHCVHHATSPTLVVH